VAPDLRSSDSIRSIWRCGDGLRNGGVTLAAPAHAIYRNAYGPNERSYYSLAAAELAREWHQRTSASLTDVTATTGWRSPPHFYAADHPFYQQSFQISSVPASSHETAVDEGGRRCALPTTRAVWAGWKAWPRRPRMWSLPNSWSRRGSGAQPGVPAEIAAMMVLPRGDVASWRRHCWTAARIPASASANADPSPAARSDPVQDPRVVCAGQTS